MSTNDQKPISRRRLLQASAAVVAAVTGPELPRSTAIHDAVAGGGTPSSGAATTLVTPGVYIARRLKQLNCGHLFGVPGKTCDGMYDGASAEGLSIVVTSSDLEAGYAADGYARTRGLSAVSVTYGVGTLSLVNAIAGAYVERSPVVVINGGASASDLASFRNDGFLFSHSIGREVMQTGDVADQDVFNIHTDRTIFREVTAYAKRAETIGQVKKVVDDALLAALTKKRPVYIEIPKDLWEKREVPAPGAALVIPVPEPGEERAIARDMLRRLGQAQRPALLLGIELQRFGLADQAAALVQRLGVPWSTTMLAKAVISETTPGFIGVYDGRYAPAAVRTTIEQADVLVCLGTILGVQYRDLLKPRLSRMIRAVDGKVKVGGDTAKKADLRLLVAELQTLPFTKNPNWRQPPPLAGLSFDQRRASSPAPAAPALPAADPGMTYDEVMRTISGFLDASFLTITDTTLSMYPAADLNIAGRGGFMCNALWQAIGFSVAAGVGVGKAQSERRPLVICGDGGFQMTAQALSTYVQEKIPGIVVVLDNGSYGIEQFLIDRRYFDNPPGPGNQLLPFLDLGRWNYADLAKAMRFDFTRTVATAADLGTALTAARGATGPALISARIKDRSLPSELQRA
jgi:indolepyruvate decarboxylase